MKMRKRKRTVLGRSFFARPAPVVARDLLDKFLVRKIEGREVAAMITETEAYTGKGDMSSHARMGLTSRNRAMFGPPGHWYVYFIYGMYHCVNIVTEKEGEAGAVLIRGLAAPERGEPRPAGRENPVTGPGKICRELSITKELYGKPASKKTGLWIEGRGVSLKNSGYRIQKTARINVGGAEKFKRRLWRFVLVREG